MDKEQKKRMNEKFAKAGIEALHIGSVIIRCPVCKSENIEDNSTYADNGVYGSGFSSWKTSDSRCCEDCGIIFKAVKGNGL